MKRGLNIAMYAVSGIAIALALSFATVSLAGHGLSGPAPPVQPVLATTPSPTPTSPPRPPSPKPSLQPSPPAPTHTPTPAQPPVTVAPPPSSPSPDDHGGSNPADDHGGGRDD